MSDKRTDPTEFTGRQHASSEGELLTAARDVLGIHVRDPDDGTCTGCLTQWNRWVPHDGCTQTQWARDVIEQLAGRHDDPVHVAA